MSIAGSGPALLSFSVSIYILLLSFGEHCGPICEMTVLSSGKIIIGRTHSKVQITVWFIGNLFSLIQKSFTKGRSRYTFS